VVSSNRDILCKPDASVCTSTSGLCQTYVIMGQPTPLRRPRLSPTASYCMYDSQKGLKQIHKIELESQHTKYHPQSLILAEIPLRLVCTFYMTIPRTSDKRAHDIEGTWHFFKPDTSNLLKYVEDVSVGVLIYDDNLIGDIQVSKVYSAIPRTEFRLEVLKSRGPETT
jgi:Holliday junction resolvase RusA-like endonuclease